MIQKKICLVGAFAVGKTSLVAQFVHAIFSERYLTTVGVKIDKKVVTIGSESVKLVIWDLAGEDDIVEIRSSYLRGANGYLLVVDSTRAATLEVAVKFEERMRREVGRVPHILLLNKCDLAADWALDLDRLASLEDGGLTILKSSAKTGENVEEAFLELAGRMVD